MFHYLSQWRELFFGLNIFRYITFRAAMAAVTAFVLCVILGPFFISRFKRKKITEDVLRQALAVQKLNVSMLMGEIIVEMNEISKTDLEKHIEAYLIMCKESVLNETSQWLGQDEVDNLSLQFFKTGTT